MGYKHHTQGLWQLKIPEHSACVKYYKRYIAQNHDKILPPLVLSALTCLTPNWKINCVADQFISCEWGQYAQNTINIIAYIFVIIIIIIIFLIIAIIIIIFIIIAIFIIIINIVMMIFPKPLLLFCLLSAFGPSVLKPHLQGYIVTIMMTTIMMMTIMMMVIMMMTIVMAMMIMMT